ncbi:uncharacterized protein EDB91DRAFT_111588 [Suillus paluster]|uniref:uncharacterized protein n=1 Tax=Suillus paluster TaxID=48578 RepID=UPI001B8712DC|nr:uncharacterized protein EDB91DRAFT_111588 [Suillus paluster]KAG1746733.1 hypothetical protein EDB91DRAFT_111588 [Suillus paluster]
MESDFDVCVECGSLVECDHDRDIVPAVPSRGPCSLPGVGKAKLTPEIDTLDMRSVRSILPHSEVFNTYGSLSNAELLSRYGFTLPENERDIVRLGYGSLSALINSLIGVVHSFADGGNDAEMQGRIRIRNLSVPQDCCVLGDEREIGDFASLFLRIYSRLARLWTTEPRWDETGDDGMVYNVPSGSSPWALRDDPDSALPEVFNINVDGKLTHALWLFCVLFAICIRSPETMTNFAHSIFPSDNAPTRQPFVEDVKRHLLDVQTYVDNAREMSDDDGEVSVSVSSDARDDPYLSATRRHIKTDTGGIFVDENNDHASAQDSACFISSLHAPTGRSLGLDHAFDLHSGRDTGVPAHAYTTGKLTSELYNVPAITLSSNKTSTFGSFKHLTSDGLERSAKKTQCGGRTAPKTFTALQSPYLG